MATTPDHHGLKRMPTSATTSEGADSTLSSNDRQFRFGWARFRPGFLQRFNNPVAILVFICLLVAVQAKLGSYNLSVSPLGDCCK